MKEKKKRTCSLCWDCSRSVHNKCSWAKNFKPVEGWNAEPTTILIDTHCVPSYRVISCPQFKSDKEMGFGFDVDLGYANRLICDIVAFAIRDWKKANAALNGKKITEVSTGSIITPDIARSRMKEVEYFFHSTWFGTICDINPDKLIKALRNNEVPPIKLLTKGGF